MKMSLISEDMLRLMKDLIVSDDQLKEVITFMDEAFTQGLHDDPNRFLFGSVKMLNTYLCSAVVNSGTKGKFFSVDLGGTNLRIYVVDLEGDKLVPMSFPYIVPQSAMNGTSDDLFDFIAQCIKSALEELDMLSLRIPKFGFTFSFPLVQESLTSGRLIRWTKGFSTKGVVGEDVVALLKKSCNKLGLKIDDFIIINDTTGTLLCGSYEDKDTVIGVINGTGTNACYIEEAENVKKWSNEIGFKQVLINTEWGAFGEFGMLYSVITEFDLELNKNSINRGHQIYEKMISGMYIGELARLVMKKIDRVVGLFGKGFPEKLNTKDSFTAPLLSLSYEKDNFIMLFQEIFSYCLSDSEYNIIFYICQIVSDRAARLLAAGLAALLKRVKPSRCVIAADGSMFKSHPTMKKKIEETLKSLVPPEKDFKIILVSDGSGKGAALAASIAFSLDNKS